MEPHGLTLLWPLCCSPALAEILSVKDISGRKLFYVHYIDCECWAGVRRGRWVVGGWSLAFLPEPSPLLQSTNAWMNG